MAHQLDRLHKLSSRVAGQLTHFITSDGEGSVPDEGYTPDIQGNLQRKKRKDTINRVAIGAATGAGLAGAAKYGPGVRKVAGEAMVKAGGQFGPTAGGVAKNVANKGLLKGASAMRAGASGLAGLRRKLHGLEAAAAPQQFGSAGQRRLGRVEGAIRKKMVKKGAKTGEMNKALRPTWVKQDAKLDSSLPRGMQRAQSGGKMSEFSTPMDEFNKTHGDQRKVAKKALKDARRAYGAAKRGEGPVMDAAREKLRKESHAGRSAAIGALAGAGLGVVVGRAATRKGAQAAVKMGDRFTRKFGGGKRMVDITPGSVAKRAAALSKPTAISDASNAVSGAVMGSAAGIQVGGRIRKKEKQSFKRRDMDTIVNLAARIGRLNTL